MGFIPLLLLGLGVAVAAWLSWISLQSLLQARALFRLSNRPTSGPEERGRQAFHGRVAANRPLRLGFGDLLWCRTEQQVYRRRGKNSGWKTVHTEDQAAGFTIDAHAGPVHLADLPSEVQGTKSRTDTHERTGWLWGHADGDRRTVYTYLPFVGRATAVGRLDGQAVARDNKLGLLLSPYEPRKAAWLEVWKGLGGLLLVTAAISIGLYLYYQSRP